MADISIIIKEERKCLEMNEPVTHDPLSGYTYVLDFVIIIITIS